MHNFRKSLIATAGVLALVGLITASSPATSYGTASTPSKDVNVVNTPDVHVTNPVALAPGASVGLAPGATVGIDPAANTVTLSSSAEAPVVVREAADDASKQVFQRFVVLELADGELFNSTSVGVPAGKRLVIEQVAAIGVVPAGQAISPTVLTHAGGVFGRFWLQMTEIGPMSGGSRFIANQPLKAYADPSSEVVFQATRSAAAGATAVNFTISGYLVDVP